MFYLLEVDNMSGTSDFHVRADTDKTKKAKELTGYTNRELFEFACDLIIEQNKNILDIEILELNDAIDRTNELNASIKSRLKDKEVPTPPSDDENDPNELRRNYLPVNLFKEIVLYYMDDYDITDLQELNNKNKEIFRFVLINLAHHDLSIEDMNKLYADINSD